MTPHLRVGGCLALLLVIILTDSYTIGTVLIGAFTIAALINRRVLCKAGFHDTHVVLFDDNKGNYGHTLACRRRGCGWVQEL